MNWQSQTPDEPLFADLLWSRPENKKYAGKLLIIGGQSQEFAHVASGFQAAQQAGAGSIRVLLPDSLKKLAQVIPEVEFAESNKSGGFAKTALASWFELAEWADHVLLAGDFGKNSETTTLLDGFLLRGNIDATMNLSSLASTSVDFAQLMKRPLTLTIDRPLLQKLGVALGLSVPIKSTTPNVQLAEIIHQVSQGNTANLIVEDQNQTWTAANGGVVSTKSDKTNNTKLSAACAVWLMQNPKKPLEALSTAVYEQSKN